MNLAALLLDAVRAWPSRVAFELPRRGSITFEDLDRLSDDVARALEQKGVKPGDRVGVCLPKSIDSVGAIFGITENNRVLYYTRQLEDSEIQLLTIR